MKIKEMLARIRFKIPDKHHVLHHAHTATHCTYLGAVAIYAHGPYAIAAGVLLLIIILGIFLGESL